MTQNRVLSSSIVTENRGEFLIAFCEHFFTKPMISCDLCGGGCCSDCVTSDKNDNVVCQFCKAINK